MTQNVVYGVQIEKKYRISIINEAVFAVNE